MEFSASFVPLTAYCDILIELTEKHSVGEYMNNNDYLIKIDDVRIDQTCDAYFKWKDLNTYIKSLVSRGINMPDAISEPMGCYCLGYLWNKSSGGDAVTQGGAKVEFKATSVFDDDLTSFGPKCEFDKLVFLRFNLEKNLLYVYDTGYSNKDLEELPVNKHQKVKDQQEQGKRPRLSILKQVIFANNLKPTVVFDIRRIKIIEDNR